MVDVIICLAQVYGQGPRLHIYIPDQNIDKAVDVVIRLSVWWPVGWLVGLSVCHNFLKFPSPYRSTCLIIIHAAVFTGPAGGCGRHLHAHHHALPRLEHAQHARRHCSRHKVVGISESIRLKIMNQTFYIQEAKGIKAHTFNLLWTHLCKSPSLKVKSTIGPVKSEGTCKLLRS